MSRGTRRLIALSVATVLLAGCQSTIAGTGHFAADQADPSPDTDPTDTPDDPDGDDADDGDDGGVPDLRGTASCAVDEPATSIDSSALVSVELTGTGGHLDVSIELTEPPGQDRFQVVGIDVLVNGRPVLVIAAGFTPGLTPQVTMGDPRANTSEVLPDGPLVNGSTVTFSVPADKLTDVGASWQWIGSNVFTETEVDTCPSIGDVNARPIEFPAQ